MMTPSQKGKMFFLRIVGVVGTYSTRNIDNEKEIFFYYEIHQSV